MSDLPHSETAPAMDMKHAGSVAPVGTIKFLTRGASAPRVGFSDDPNTVSNDQYVIMLVCVCVCVCVGVCFKEDIFPHLLPDFCFVCLCLVNLCVLRVHVYADSVIILVSLYLSVSLCVSLCLSMSLCDQTGVL
jgi:hypothetical protein